MRHAHKIVASISVFRVPDFWFTTKDWYRVNKSADVTPASLLVSCFILLQFVNKTPLGAGSQADDLTLGCELL